MVIGIVVAIDMPTNLAIVVVAVAAFAFVFVARTTTATVEGSAGGNGAFVGILHKEVD